MTHAIQAHPFGGAPLPEFVGDDECTVVFHPQQHKPAELSARIRSRGPAWLLGAAAGITVAAAAVAITSLVGWSPYVKPAPGLDARPTTAAPLSGHTPPVPLASVDPAPADEQTEMADPYAAADMPEPALGDQFDPAAGEPAPGLPDAPADMASPYPQPPPPGSMASQAQPAVTPGAPTAISGAPTSDPATRQQPRGEGDGDLSRPQRRPLGDAPTSLMPGLQAARRQPHNRSQRPDSQGAAQADPGALRGPLIGLG